MKYTNRKIIEMQDWDDLVTETYDKPYSFQQQEGCKDRGVFTFEVPIEEDDFENDTIEEKVNGEEMGVSFKAWLARDPKQPLASKGDQDFWSIDLFWTRNFYPHVSMLISDLHKKGLLEEGEYIINIDW